MILFPSVHACPPRPLAKRFSSSAVPESDSDLRSQGLGQVISIALMVFHTGKLKDNEIADE